MAVGGKGISSTGRRLQAAAPPAAPTVDSHRAFTSSAVVPAESFSEATSTWTLLPFTATSARTHLPAQVLQSTAAMAVYIQHKETEQVVDVKGSDTEPGAAVVLYTYYATPNQHWQLKGGRIVSELSGLVLDVDADTGKLVTMPESDSPSQQWTVEDSGELKNGEGRFLTAVDPDSEDSEFMLAASPERCDNPTQHFAIVTVEAS